MELTDEQIAKLTPEQVTEFEKNPDAIAEYLASQENPDKEPEEESTEEPKQEEETSDEEGAANGVGEEEAEEDKQEPTVLTKNGKGVIPYEKHKALRVENAELKEQLQKLKSAQAELESLRKQKAEAGTPGKRAAIQAALVKRIGTMKEDFPDVGDSLDSINQLITDIAQELAEEKSANKARAEAEAAEQKRIIDEQVQEAKENNPDLVYWEAHDEDAWREAMMQDQALLQNPKWAKKSYEERFSEVVKRVRAVLPDASEPPNQAPSAKTQAKAKARLEKAPVRKPTTLSDVQGGGNPASERELMENLTPHQLAARLLKMPDGKASALRAELD